jgi:general secretion pathway protein L
MALSFPLTRLSTTADVLRSNARRFWTWWTQELIGLLPEPWLQRLRQRGATLLIELDGNQCQLRFGSYASAEVLASAPFDASGELPAMLAAPLKARAAKADQVVLRLPAERGLRKVVSLPAATEASLGNVLRFELDRHTPFSSEQVYFGYRILKREADRQRLQVELQLVPKVYLDPLLAQLASLDVHPGRVSLSVADDSEQASAGWIDLLPASRRGARASWRSSRGLQWTLLLLGLAALILLPLQQRQYSAERLQQQLQQPKAQAERAAAVQHELQQLESGRTFLAEQQLRATQTLLLLSELTQLLPDHTWLTRFEVSQQRVRLEGESAEASSLIGLLERSQYLHNVSFVSPITNNPRTQRDRFSLQAEHRPAGEQP